MSEANSKITAMLFCDNVGILGRPGCLTQWRRISTKTKKPWQKGGLARGRWPRQKRPVESGFPRFRIPSRQKLLERCAQQHAPSTTDRQGRPEQMRPQANKIGTLHACSFLQGNSSIDGHFCTWWARSFKEVGVQCTPCTRPAWLSVSCVCCAPGASADI